jgi:iron complex transport system ATP-binding protein
MAARYADLIVALKDGEVIASGAPADVMTGHVLRTVFGIEATITDDRLTGAPLVMPIQAASADAPEDQFVS